MPDAGDRGAIATSLLTGRATVGSDGVGGNNLSATGGIHARIPGARGQGEVGLLEDGSAIAEMLPD